MPASHNSAQPAGAMYINADDWGRDRLTTDRTHDCVRHGTVSSVSAMVFMADSERAGGVAREIGLDAGLHLNFTTALSGSHCPARLVEHHGRIAAYLGRHRAARVLFHPGLTGSFQYVVAAQVDEYRRVYGTDPARLDGHHHMHLCANVLMGGLLPRGTVVRRNFSFGPSEKSMWNRMFRRAQDRWLSRRHMIADYFFPLPPMTPAGRLERIFELAERFIVELETHPIADDEYKFLMGEGILRLNARTAIGPPLEILGRRSRMRA